MSNSHLWGTMDVCGSIMARAVRVSLDVTLDRTTHHAGDSSWSVRRGRVSCWVAMAVPDACRWLLK